jgi:hypothetical protein
LPGDTQQRKQRRSGSASRYIDENIACVPPLSEYARDARLLLTVEAA